MDAAVDFERSKVAELKRSRTVAWAIAFVSTGICSIAIIGMVIASIVHTEPAPVILRVDNSTGATTVLRPVLDVYDHYDEVVNKYWLAQYVRNCEGYDWFTVSVDVDTCMLMSEPEIAKEMLRKVRAPGSPLNELKDRGRVRVKVVAIAFIDKTAQIRFTTQQLSTSGEALPNAPLHKWIATLAYYFRPAQMTEQQRLVNPLGFRVASYRVDPEVIQ